MTIVGGRYISQVPLWPLYEAARALQTAAGRRSKKTRRVNVCPLLSSQPRGEVPLHALDVSNLRRGISAAWRFDGLLDTAALSAALLRAVARFPPVAGWVEAAPGGGLALKWDARAPGRGVAWTEASCRGAPPAVDDDEGLYEGGFLPRLQRHCLLALRATHFPDACCTLLVATIDHVVADFQAFIDFLTAWSDEAAGEAATAAKRAGKVPVWDRRLMAPRARGAGGCSEEGSGSLGCGFSGDSGDSGDGGSGGSADGGGSPTASPSGTSGSSSLWDAASPLWHAKPPTRRENLRITSNVYVNVIFSETRDWVLPRPVVASLKRELGTAMPPGAAPTANDVLSALLAAGVAWADPGRAAARGGLNVHIVVNGRGRFGQGTDASYFGNDSMLVPVWCPSFLLPAAGSPSPLPSPALVAHIHTTLREMLAHPSGLMRRRYEWMAAVDAGEGARVRHCEGASLIDGDVCVDNVSNYPVFDMRFGSDKVAAACSTRFIVIPRLAWVSAAGPAADRSAGGPSGDLRVSMPLEFNQWQALSPHWAAAGLRLVRVLGAVDQAGYHPASIRNSLTVVTRSTIMGL